MSGHCERRVQRKEGDKWLTAAVVHGSYAEARDKLGAFRHGMPDITYRLVRVTKRREAAEAKLLESEGLKGKP